MSIRALEVAFLSSWIRWHRDGRGFSHVVMASPKGLIIANYRLMRSGGVRRELILVPKRSEVGRGGGKLLFEEHYDKFKVSSLIQALKDLSSISSRSSLEDLVSELDKVILHLNFLKKLVLGVIEGGGF